MDSAPTKPIRKKAAETAENVRRSAGGEIRPGGLGPLLAWWVWPIGGLMGLAAAAAIWILVFVAPLPNPPAGAVPPLFTVYPPPTLTPIPPTLTFTPFYTSTPALPTIIPGTIGIGGRVEVTEDGVRLREAPSLSGRILNQAAAHELFNVVDGPRQSDGYTWWLLQAVYDAERQGWAAETFLRPA